MKKITRRNFLIASGKTVGTLAAASAFMGTKGNFRKYINTNLPQTYSHLHMPGLA